VINFKLLTDIAFSLLAVQAWAKQPGANQTVEREIALDSCHFKFNDPYGGRASVDNESSPHSASYLAIINPNTQHSFETSIFFDCEKGAGINDFPKPASVKKKGGEWEIAFDGDAKAFNTKLYPLQGNKWEGAGITQDQSNGDEGGRTRFFTFCLAHAEQVLCGSSDSVAYLEYQNESVLPQIIKLLESIEFIDTPSSEPAQPSTTSSAR
jgi:hypothetical protein